jgi:Flp pilus assembly protein TadD
MGAVPRYAFDFLCGNETVARHESLGYTVAAMKKYLVLCFLFAVCSCGLSRLWAAPDPGEQFLDAYFLIQDGDAAENKGDWVRADSKFKAALDILRAINSQNPNWNPHVIGFRVKYCADHLEALKPKLPVAPPPPPAPPTPATPTAPAASSETHRIQQLTAELQQSQENIRQLQQDRDTLKAQFEGELQKRSPSDREEAQKTLEQLRSLQAARDALTARLQEAEAKAAQVETLKAELQQSQEKLRQSEADRDQINAKLQASLSQTAPAQTAPAQATPQIEELLRKNAELTAQVAELKERLGGGTAGTAADQIQLRTELLQTRSESERTKQHLETANQELASARQELEQARAENVRLNQSQKEIMAKLNEADRQLRAVKSSTENGNEIIRQLRKENAVLRGIAERKGPVTIRAREATQESGLNNELRGWSPRRRPPATVAPAKPATPERESSAASMKESGSSKLVATINAPAPPAPTRPSAPAPSTYSEPATTTAPPPITVAATNAIARPVAAAEQVRPAGAGGLKAMLNEARAAAALKDYDTAALKYQEILTNDPTNVTALSNMGAIRYQQGRLDEAEGFLRKAVTAAPHDSASRSLLGVVFSRTGKLDDAFNELTRAVALDPRNAEAHNYLGITLSAKGWSTAAEQEIRRAIELDPQYADAHFNLAAIYAKQKTPRWELARYHYQKALDLGAQPDPQLDALLKSASAPKPSETNTDQPQPQQPPATP